MPKTKPKYFWVICSIAGVLTSIGIAILGYVFVYQSVAQSATKRVIMVDVEASAPVESIQTIQNYIQTKGYAVEGSLQYDSSEAIIRQVNSLLGVDDPMAVNASSFESIIRFELAAQHLNDISIIEIQTELERLPDVVMAFISPLEDASNIKRSFFILLLPVLALGCLMLGIAFALIYGAVRLHMHTNRFHIKTMQLVGASPKFVLKPYLKRATINALIAFGLSILALATVTFAIFQIFPWIQFQDHLIIIIVSTACLGVLSYALSHWSTKRAVQKYLALPIDELY